MYRPGTVKRLRIRKSPVNDVYFLAGLEVDIMQAYYLARAKWKEEGSSPFKDLEDEELDEFKAWQEEVLAHRAQCPFCERQLEK